MPIPPTPHILLVDDEPSVLLALRRELEDFNYQISCASSGKEALTILENEKIDLVISDMRMPEMTGTELFIIMLEQWPKIGRILLTGYSDVHAIAQAINQGKIFHYLNKPWLSSQMTEVIESFFKGRKEAETQDYVLRRTIKKNKRLVQENDVLRDQALIDSLTGIGNRRFFDNRLKKEVSRAIRKQKPMSLLLADIDCFKPFNDTLGHQAGDECLERVAQKINDSFKRGEDVPARYGGEEFVIILAETELEGQAFRAGEHLRLSISNLGISHPASTVSEYITMSVGVATLDLETDDASDLIAKADMALYFAKETGRNKVARIPRH